MNKYQVVHLISRGKLLNSIRILNQFMTIDDNSKNLLPNFFPVIYIHTDSTGLYALYQQIPIPIDQYISIT